MRGAATLEVQIGERIWTAAALEDEATLAELVRVAKAAEAEQGDAFKIVLRGSPGASWESVQSLMQRLAEHGFARLTFDPSGGGASD